MLFLLFHVQYYNQVLGGVNMRKKYFIYEVQTNSIDYMREFIKTNHFNSRDMKIFEEMEERNASTHVFSYLMKQDDMILIRVYVNID